MTYLEAYILSVVICAAIGLIELSVRLRKDVKTSADYSKFTWGELAIFAAIAVIPAVNVLIFMWFPFGRAWDVVERLLGKWDKPIIRAKDKQP